MKNYFKKLSLAGFLTLSLATSALLTGCSPDGGGSQAIEAETDEGPFPIPQYPLSGVRQEQMEQTTSP